MTQRPTGIFNTSQSFYDVLGIPVSATSHEVREAFRKLAQIYHPDTGSESEEIFKQITEAYHALSDPVRRNEYNRTHGFEFYEEVDISSFQDKEEERKVSEPQVLEPQKPKVDLSRSGIDMSHLQGLSGLKVGHKVGLTDKEELERLKQEEADVGAWGESDSKAGIFGSRKKSVAPRREDLKKNLKTTLEKENQPKRTKSPAVMNPVQNAVPPPQHKSLVPEFATERVHICQITALEAAVGTTREIVMSETRDGTPNKLQFEIPAGIKEGNEIEVSRGWDRATVQVRVVQDPLVQVNGLDVKLFVPITFKEALDGVQAQVPGIDQRYTVSIPPRYRGLDGVEVDGAGIKSKDGEGRLLVVPYVVPPQQPSPTLTAVAKVLGLASKRNVRSEFHQDPLASKFFVDFGDCAAIFMPISFQESVEGLTEQISLAGRRVEVKFDAPWKYAQRIELTGAFAEPTKILLVLPIIDLPHEMTNDVQAAALAIDQLYLTTPRAKLPRVLCRPKN